MDVESFNLWWSFNPRKLVGEFAHELSFSGSKIMVMGLLNEDDIVPYARVEMEAWSETGSKQADRWTVKLCTPDGYRTYRFKWYDNPEQAAYAFVSAFRDKSPTH